MSTEIENVIIIGSGPAGYTAALYASRADLNPLVIEGFVWGGLLQTTTDVENYPGFPEGVMGPEMMQKFRDQAERFGARFISHDATRVELSDDGSPHRVFVDDDEYQARAVILAMGAEHKKLGVPGEEELANSGISYCATCGNGYVLTEGKSTLTNVAGVFAAGDLVDHTYRQAVTAAGTGCQAALDAEWYLRDLPPAAEAHWMKPDEIEAMAEKVAAQTQ